MIFFFATLFSSHCFIYYVVPYSENILNCLNKKKNAQCMTGLFLKKKRSKFIRNYFISFRCPIIYFHLRNFVCKKKCTCLFPLQINAQSKCIYDRYCVHSSIVPFLYLHHILHWLTLNVQLSNIVFGIIYVSVCKNYIFAIL